MSYVRTCMKAQVLCTLGNCVHRVLRYISAKYSVPISLSPHTLPSSPPPPLQKIIHYLPISLIDLQDLDNYSSYSITLTRWAYLPIAFYFLALHHFTQVTAFWDRSGYQLYDCSITRLVNSFPGTTRLSYQSKDQPTNPCFRASLCNIDELTVSLHRILLHGTSAPTPVRWHFRSARLDGLPTLVLLSEANLLGSINNSCWRNLDFACLLPTSCLACGIA